MSKFEISIEEPTKDFGIHLSHEGNNRILFSAPFGAGKTYFLKEFFKDKEKYDVVRLYPVNYSVASNEDIFELIKHDILFELLKKDDLDIDNEEFSDLFIAQNFLYENPIDIIKPFVENTSELGKSIVPIFDSLKKLQNKYKLFKEQVNKNDTLSAFQYLKSFQGKKGSVYEQDFYTELIRNLVQQLNGKGKETVLIIDDLDRIDPEHIFRLLNVFAAHFDHNDSENKFGFSKIIFVTDVANLKSIFATKYGEKTDFSGYLNKFFSLNVFVFDNLKNILEGVSKFYDTIIPSTEETRTIFRFKNYDGTIRLLVLEVLQWFIKNNKITLRSLIKLPERKYHYKNDVLVGLGSYMTSRKSTFIIIPVIDFICYVFGSAQLMEQAFFDFRSEITIEFSFGRSDPSLLASTIFLLDKNKNKLNAIYDNNLCSFKLNSLNGIQIDYVLQHWSGREQGIHSTIRKIEFDKEPKNEGLIFPIEILYQTLKILQSDFDLFKS